MISSFQLYKTVYLSRVKQMARRDIVLLVVILALLPRGASQLTAMLASSPFPSVYIGLGSWLIGFIAGISLFAASSHVAEARFLWSSGRGGSFLTAYSLWKKTPFLLLLAWIIIGQLMWTPSHADMWLWLILMLLGFSYAEVSGYSYRSGRLAFQWLAVMWLAVNLAGVVLPLALAARMLGAAIIIALQFLCAFRAAEYAWPQVMRSTLPAETGAKTRMLSHYPLFRKELYLVTRFKDVVPFLFCIFALELFCFYAAADSPAVIPIGAGLLIWLANEIWTVRGFANEGRGLSLYTVTLDAWRTMLSAKWLFYWTMGASIAAIHYLGWQFGIERSWTNSMMLFLKSSFLASTLASFGLLAGYRFTSSGRITLVGQLWITPSMILLLYLHQLHFVLFILSTAVIQIGFIRLYRTIPDKIPANG
ncbi:hypothetical protein J27TS7_35720 [Paenibacillus dendritiformis]|uniref:hypothetical protein n=1 Tax=Paenibacillus dendritiformis TaxID=130049 RepID=UPI001AFCE626|nr:hypothetical protein [Paenibacillus dendritiformis]GIO74058.1 hypothetical protein J27TS7_35720 [Paenibacillus dendritiformis]